MKPCPIKFEFRGKEVKGTFDPGSGSGRAYHWHLMVDKYYWGALWYTDIWRFESNWAEELREYSDFFGDYLVAWYESNWEE